MVELQRKKAEGISKKKYIDSEEKIIAVLKQIRKKQTI